MINYLKMTEQNGTRKMAELRIDSGDGGEQYTFDQNPEKYLRAYMLKLSHKYSPGLIKIVRGHPEIRNIPDEEGREPPIHDWEKEVGILDSLALRTYGLKELELETVNTLVQQINTCRNLFDKLTEDYLEISWQVGSEIRQQRRNSRKENPEGSVSTE